jgi:hypothetical protein
LLGQEYLKEIFLKDFQKDLTLLKIIYLTLIIINYHLKEIYKILLTLYLAKIILMTLSRFHPSPFYDPLYFLIPKTPNPLSDKKI